MKGTPGILEAILGDSWEIWDMLDISNLQEALDEAEASGDMILVETIRQKLTRTTQ
jgi:hypothetical protein